MVVEHTGLSRYLPDTDGLFRFRSFDEAAAAIRTIGADYEGQCRKRECWRKNSLMLRRLPQPFLSVHYEGTY